MFQATRGCTVSALVSSSGCDYLWGWISLHSFSGIAQPIHSLHYKTFKAPCAYYPKSMVKIPEILHMVCTFCLLFTLYVFFLHVNL